MPLRCASGPQRTDGSLLVLQGEGESKPAADPKSFGRPRLSSIGQVYAGLSDEEVEVGLCMAHRLSDCLCSL